MKLSTTTLAVLATVVLLTGATTAFAETGRGGEGERPQQGGGMPRPPKLSGTPGMMGSSTVRGGRMGSSTEDRDERMGSTTGMRPDVRRGVPGIVTSVGTTSFVMSGRGLGNDHASTTFTVNVTNATKYQHGSTTASLANITVGTKVEVLGTVATSTRTITADRVVFGMQDRMGDDRGKSEQAPGQLKKAGFFEKLKHFFGVRSNTGSTTASGGPAAAGSSGDFMGTLAQALFGWMH